MSAVDIMRPVHAQEQVRLRTWSAPSPRCELLVLPGRGDPVEKYDGLARDAVDAGAVVTAVDWYGQGRSSRADAPVGALHVDDFARYQRDLQEANLHLDRGAPRVIVAYSMGGLIALRALAAGALRADRVALISPMLRFRDSAPEPLTRILSRLAEFGGHGARFAPGERWTPPSECTLADNMAVDDPDAFSRLTALRLAHPAGLVTGSTWGWAGAATREMAAVRALTLSRVTAPVTIFSSTEDRSVDPAEHERLATRLPNATLVRLAGRHDLLVEGGATGRAVSDAILGLVRDVANPVGSAS